jgi:membrane protein
MAGATAFFTTFALPAVLIILIQVFGIFFTPRFMANQLFNNLGHVVGNTTSVELHKVLKNVRHLFKNWYQATLGFLFLIFVATTLLKVITDSLNQLWNIRRNKDLGIRFTLLNRAKSFLVILAAGLLFLVVLLADGGINLLKQNSDQSVVADGSAGGFVLRQLISFILVSAWFSMLFKFLPDGKPGWKTVIAGGAFTGILFSLGKLVLQWLLSYDSMQTIYGASTSFVLTLLFVFYSSFIFYFGACFTKVWAELHNNPIQPNPNAEKYEWSHVRV